MSSESSEEEVMSEEDKYKRSQTIAALTARLTPELTRVGRICKRFSKLKKPAVWAKFVELGELTLDPENAPDTVFVSLMKDKTRVYTGEWVKSSHKYQGIGSLVMDDGSIFEGHFQDGEAKGFGRLIDSNADVYEGTWENQKVQGFGRIHSQGRIYDGEIVDTLPHGRGRMKLANGNLYEGDFKQGVISGKGVLSHIGKFKYSGDFLNGEMSGVGKYEWDDGQIYEGDWVNGEMHGKGVYIWPDGKRYEGDYSHNKREGLGNMLYPDKSKYEGHWLDGLRDGAGIRVFASGDRQKGLWEQGKFLLQDEESFHAQLPLESPRTISPMDSDRYRQRPPTGLAFTESTIKSVNDFVEVSEDVDDFLVKPMEKQPGNPASGTESKADEAHPKGLNSQRRPKPVVLPPEDADLDKWNEEQSPPVPAGKQETGSAKNHDLKSKSGSTPSEKNSAKSPLTAPQPIPASEDDQDLYFLKPEPKVHKDLFDLGEIAPTELPPMEKEAIVEPVPKEESKEDILPVLSRGENPQPLVSDVNPPVETEVGPSNYSFAKSRDDYQEESSSEYHFLHTLPTSRTFDPRQYVNKEVFALWEMLPPFPYSTLKLEDEPPTIAMQWLQREDSYYRGFLDSLDQFAGFGTLLTPEMITEGQWLDGQLNGIGRKVTTQHILTGYWTEGLLTGFGTLLDKDKGSVYSGDWVQSEKSGKGYQGSAHNTYIGGFKDNKRSGQGRMVTSEFVYEGEFLEGKRHGFGKALYKDEHQYVGLWVNGKPEGVGVHATKDKVMFYGQYEGGKNTKGSFFVNGARVSNYM